MSSSGLSTFLFTDIEGSTRLWESDRVVMETALERHDALLAEAFAAGDRFKHTGDGMCVAFESPSDAARAAVSVQQALADEAWPTSSPIRVRVGIHTGEAHRRGGDYFGPAVNRTARLMDIAHGGQVVLSSAARSLLVTAPAGVTFRDLGEHRLKDLGESDRVYQLVAPGLPAEFPPLRSLESYATNLPVQLTSFVGRSAELAEVLEMLDEARLVTLTGVGGVGKTRLALQAAAESLDRFPDGVWLVELAPVADAALVIQEMADALGAQEEATRAVLDVVVDHLRDRSTLIVLDNCEHVIDEAAKVSEIMLRSAPGLKMITTSREGLSISGERLWRVPSMTRSGGNSDAVELFVERAKSFQPEFVLDAENEEAITKICHRLDGIPLAIELATARLKVFTPRQIAERLDDRFRLLTGGSRTALPRQRTLQATMDWSYDLLTEHQRILLRRLSVFYGGFDFETAEEVCGEDPLDRYEVLDLLTHLIESSLVLVQEQSHGSRYALLETVRQYGLDRLVESGGADEARLRHAEHFAALADTVDDGLLADPSGELIGRADHDHDNVRAALTWSLESGRHDLAIRLASGMSRYWFFRAFIREGGEWQRRVIESAPPEDTALYTELLSWAGTFLMHQSKLLEGEGLVRRAFEVAERVGDDALIARAENSLGNAHITRGDLETALGHYEHALARADPGYRSVVLVNACLALVWLGRTDEARRMADSLDGTGKGVSWGALVRAWIEEYDGTVDSTEAAFRAAYERAVESGERVLEGWSLVGTADTARRRGAFGEARDLLAKADRIARETGSGMTEVAGAFVECRLAIDEGDAEGARAALRRLLSTTGQNEDVRGRAQVAELAARLALLQGHAEQGVRLLGASDRYLADHHTSRPPYADEELAALLAGAREMLGDRLDGLLAEGAALDFPGLGEAILAV